MVKWKIMENGELCLGEYGNEAEARQAVDVLERIAVSNTVRYSIVKVEEDEA
jgi:hypothetical protein